MKNFIARRSSAVAHAIVPFAVLALTPQIGLAQAPGEPAPAAQVTVAMDYVVPPFVAGSKVRTPEAIDTTLAEQLAERLKAELHAVPARDMEADAAGQENAGRVVLASLPPGAAVPPAYIEVPTGYRAKPMAILRSDTNIKRWEQLQGKTLCVSKGGRYAGVIAARYGALEKVYRAPADSLLALRTGQCDAAVHDDDMLNELLKLPEWKKFSATLKTNEAAGLSFLVPATDDAMATTVRTLAEEWKAKGYLASLRSERVRDIAFEVYLDQTVADCH
ncbi:transporter substrate-binding domain-containing protein [Parapusillimonas sp. SGNA-6]|jgi:polar amino acid transport system substrate-binding protein|nr:transporter substrate-binding domain-containing protein [Parapusillimonas sp. SGNA-6]